MEVNELQQAAIPAGEQSSASEVELQPSNLISSETGAEQNTASGQQADQGNGESGGQGQQQQTKKTPWYQHRINELTRKQKEESERATRAESERQRLEAQLASYQNQQPQQGQQQSATQQPVQQSQQDVDRLVQERVQQQLKQQSFNDRCNQIYQDGIKEFPDFGESIKSFADLGGLPDGFVEAAISLDGGHRVLHHLSQNLELAFELKNLSPIQLGARMSQLSSDLKKPTTKPVSSAPSPVKPIDGGSSRGDIDLSKASLDEFMEQRAKKPIKR
ncbi:hypothetical protein [Tolumonas lignilytica]|uniref:hypothetical protein n=1 Tax=Tolumonas lignilytica TaxID=1283284 RepID=UPI000465580A|nr:hypothetical protein [Tolumonas lignilytica]